MFDSRIYPVSLDQDIFGGHSRVDLRIYPLDKISLGEGILGGHSRVELLAQKVQLVWGLIYDVTIGSLCKVVHIIRSAIGSVVRDAFFFPMKWSLIANSQAVQDQLLLEENYCSDFWDPTKPLDPSLNLHAEIRENFAIPEDLVIPIRLKDGRSVEITCQVIQTKESGDSFYNFAHIPGIYTTIYNNIGTIHPYLAAYLKSHNEAESLPPARFIMISENNLNFKPATLDEAGFVLLETLKALKERFGELDQLVAHSLGNIFLANALKQMDDPTPLPKHICLDRGPTSIWEASKKYFFGMGRLIYVLAQCGEWASDIEQDIIDFYQTWEKRPSLLITGVRQDHYFSGEANLCLGEKIKKIDGIEFLVFDPPRQLIHQAAQHNLKSDFFNSRYLTVHSELMKPLENLSETIIRRSLPITEAHRCSA
ncbi:MAG: hypothetical protein K9M07_04635 [Simkaniaceae bacterium]|nr:hypothetical protein [Simkaniaceae bacterium]